MLAAETSELPSFIRRVRRWEDNLPVVYKQVDTYARYVARREADGATNRCHLVGGGLTFRSAAFAQHTKSRDNQTTLGGASLRFLQGCGFFWSFGPARVWSNSKRRKRSRKQFP